MVEGESHKAVGRWAYADQSPLAVPLVSRLPYDFRRQGPRGGSGGGMDARLPVVARRTAARRSAANEVGGADELWRWLGGSRSERHVRQPLGGLGRGRPERRRLE